MPTVETTVSVSVPEGATVGEIEAVVAQALRTAGQEMLQQAVSACERAQLDGVARDKRRSIDLLTSFGWLKLDRWYVRDRQGRYRYLVESGGGPEHATVAVVEQAVALATRLPYRQAALLLGRLLGEHVDHRSLYAWVKAEGQTLVDEEAALQEAVFTDGVVPPRDEEERELVVAVVDGTYLKAQREGQPSFEVRIGVAYSGRALVSETAKHRRYRLVERQLYGGVDSYHDFAERFYLKAEATLGLSRARHLLVVGDGADWIEALAGHERYKATYQLDHWHILEHARRTFSDRPELSPPSPPPSARETLTASSLSSASPACRRRPTSSASCSSSPTSALTATASMAPVACVNASPALAAAPPSRALVPSRSRATCSSPAASSTPACAGRRRAPTASSSFASGSSHAALDALAILSLGQLRRGGAAAPAASLLESLQASSLRSAILGHYSQRALSSG